LQGKAVKTPRKGRKKELQDLVDAEGQKSASKAACFDEEHAAERGAKRRGGVKVHERRKGFLNKAPTDMHQKP
jgi:hypothetical protein